MKNLKELEKKAVRPVDCNVLAAIITNGILRELDPWQILNTIRDPECLDKLEFYIKKNLMPEKYLWVTKNGQTFCESIENVFKFVRMEVSIEEINRETLILDALENNNVMVYRWEYKMNREQAEVFVSALIKAVNVIVKAEYDPNKVTLERLQALEHAHEVYGDVNQDSDDDSDLENIEGKQEQESDSDSDIEGAEAIEKANRRAARERRNIENNLNELQEREQWEREYIDQLARIKVEMEAANKINEGNKKRIELLEQENKQGGEILNQLLNKQELERKNIFERFAEFQKSMLANEVENKKLKDDIHKVNEELNKAKKIAADKAAEEAKSLAMAEALRNRILGKFRFLRR